MTSKRGEAKVSCRHVWKIFGPNPQSVADTLDAGGHSKDSILEETGHVLAVRAVSFDVQEGETFVVMGLSGSGKSTLLRCLPRLIQPTRGQILIDGQDTTVADKKTLRAIRRNKMSMVFQHFGLLSHRKVIDNVAFGLEIQGVGKTERYAKAREVLALVNLRGWEDYYPDQLSGGMQQRVGLARALAVDPEILLFDEPFSALDPLIRREMQDELINLQQQMHKTLVFITHDFAEAIKLGDHIAIMKDGEFVQVGTAEDVVLHPADAYVAEFTRDVPKSKVVTVRNVMRPPQHGPLSGTPVKQTAKLEEVIPLVAGTDALFPVVDMSGALVGVIDRTDVMLALSEEAGSPQRARPSA